MISRDRIGFRASKKRWLAIENCQIAAPSEDGDMETIIIVDGRMRCSPLVRPMGGTSNGKTQIATIQI
jgi:hypothetical protein